MIKKFLLLMPIIILSLFFVNIAPAFAADDIDMNLTSNETSNTMATASTYQPTTSSTYSTTPDIFWGQCSHRPARRCARGMSIHLHGTELRSRRFR